MRGRKAGKLTKGETYGCWAILREATADHYGRARYAARATCCGREAIQARHSLMRCPPACTRCVDRRGRWAPKPESA